MSDVVNFPVRVIVMLTDPSRRGLLMMHERALKCSATGQTPNLCEIFHDDPYAVWTNPQKPYNPHVLKPLRNKRPTIKFGQ